MTALDYILNGLEAELQLERELGVRFVECDRSVLEPVAVEGVEYGAGKVSPPGSGRMDSVSRAQQSASFERSGASIPDDASLAAACAAGKCYDFVFLHEKPLSPKGSEIMSKIVAALKTRAELAPVVCSEPLPEAKIYVVLGALALRKWFSGLKGAPGMWIKDQGGRDMLVTYSPEYILRFRTVTPTVEKIKKEMWTSLKAVAQRAAQKK